MRLILRACGAQDDKRARSGKKKKRPLAAANTKGPGSASRTLRWWQNRYSNPSSGKESSAPRRPRQDRISKHHATSQGVEGRETSVLSGDRCIASGIESTRYTRSLTPVAVRAPPAPRRGCSRAA